MLYCSHCAHEYQAGLTTCPDCRLPLVERAVLRTSASEPDDSWVEVGLMENDVQMAIACDALTASNVPNMVLSAQFAAGGQRPSADAAPLALFGQAVVVPREFRDEAEAILDAVLGDGTFDEDED